MRARGQAVKRGMIVFISLFSITASMMIVSKTLENKIHANTSFTGSTIHTNNEDIVTYGNVIKPTTLKESDFALTVYDGTSKTDAGSIIKIGDWDWRLVHLYKDENGNLDGTGMLMTESVILPDPYYWNSTCQAKLNVTCVGKFSAGELYKAIYGKNDNGESMTTTGGTAQGIVIPWQESIADTNTPIGKRLIKINPMIENKKQIPYVPTLQEFIDEGLADTGGTHGWWGGYANNLRWKFLNSVPVCNSKSYPSYATAEGNYRAWDGNRYGAVDLMTRENYPDTSGWSVWQVMFDEYGCGVEKAYARLALRVNIPYKKLVDVTINMNDLTAIEGHNSISANSLIADIGAFGIGPYEFSIITDGKTSDSDIDINGNKLDSLDVNKDLSDYFYLDSLNSETGTAQLKVKSNKTLKAGDYYIKIQGKDINTDENVYTNDSGVNQLDDPTRTITKIVKLTVKEPSTAEVTGFQFVQTDSLKVGDGSTNANQIAGTFTVPAGYALGTSISSMGAGASYFKILDNKLYFRETVTEAKTYELKVYIYQQNNPTNTYAKTIQVDIGSSAPHIVSIGYNTPYQYTYGDEEITKDSSKTIAKPNIKLSAPDDGNSPYTYEFVSENDSKTYTDQSFFTINTQTGVITINSDASIDLPANESGYLVCVKVTDSHMQSLTQEVLIHVDKAELSKYEITNTNEKFKLNTEIPIVTNGKENSTGVETFEIINGKDSVAQIPANKSNHYKMLSPGKFQLKATITGDQNYKDKTVMKELELSDLDEQNDLTLENPVIIYGDNNNVYMPNISGGSGSGDTSWTLAIEDHEIATLNQDSSIQILSVGTFQLIVKKAGDDTYKEKEKTFQVIIKKKPISLNVELLDADSSYKNDVSIKIGDKLPSIRVSSNDPTIDPSTWGKHTYTYKKNNAEVDDPSIEEGIYTVSASYPSGSLAENYDITWIDATLRVDGITIDENNQSDYFTLTSDGKAYTQGTWINKDIIITPVHDTFNQMSVDDAENKTTKAYTYNIQGSKIVKLSFYNDHGVNVSTTVNLSFDKTAPTLSNFNYEDETNLRSILRTVTFDHFFGKTQRLSFTGSDEAGGSGLDHYRYEIVELDHDKKEKPASQKSGTLGLDEKLNLSNNTSYRISAWAVDVAGNESDEKIERVYLSDEVAQLNITATSDGKAYDGSTWTKSKVTVKLSSTSNAGVEKYQYSSDGVVFHDITGDTITLPDPLSDIDNVTYTFRAIHNDKTEADKTLNLKVDTVKPELNITGTVNGSPYDGSLVDENIELTMHQTNTNISGSTLYYTASPTSKDTDPKTDSNWKRYTDVITHSENGTFTYYFKAISGAGISSDAEEYTVKLAKKEYTNITVNVTSEGKLYSPGNWAKGDVTFTLSGGLKDTTQITGYEYTVTNGSKPTASSAWKPVTNKTLKLTENVKDQTYWFRVIPIDPDGKISAGTKVNLDVEAPSVPTMSVKELNNTRIAQLINLLSFGNWMNKQAEVTMTSNDSISGIDHYEYIETVNATESKPKTSNGKITYGDETELTLKARACDKAGNCSEYTDAETLKIDMKAPTIAGVKDQSEYKQYYLPRFVTVTDSVSGLKQATYKKNNTPTGTFTDNVETPIRGQGAYEIYAIDKAGNEITLNFKIVELPNINTEIDGSDESRDIIDKIIKELEEVKNKIDPNEKDNYEKWIKDAEEKWESLRKKVIEHEETTSKVEGQGNTTFDPKTELIVEEISKDQVPVLPKYAIKTYDVYLKKGNTIIQPDGSVKVYLPYDEEEAPIVYEISDDGTVRELTSKKENGYVTFVTNTLKKYAISNTAQEDTKKDVCVVGPDGKLDSKDDVCGEGNGSGVPPVKEEDGSVTVPDGGKVIFPDKEVNAPDGATINPDGSVDFPDGTHFDPNGNETKKPDPKPNPDDGKNDQVCVAGPDGKLGTADDVCGEGNGTKDPDKESDGSVTVPDGGSVIFPDGNEVELPDGGVIKPDGSVELPDGSIINPDGSKKDPDDSKKETCKLDGISINVDTDGDGLPDLNVDIDGDCKADLNIDVNDTNGNAKPDGLPDLNIDTTGDGKPNINIDTNGDGIADLNIMLNIKEWKPNLNANVNGFAYDTMSGLAPDLNVDENGDGKPDRNIDTDGDGLPDVNVDDDWFSKRGMKKPNDHASTQGAYNKGNSATGGVKTGDSTKWIIWWIVLIITGLTMTYGLIKKKHQNK